MSDEMDGRAKKPTLRWVKRYQDENRYNSYGGNSVVVRHIDHVLQQYVETSKGDKWVDVPEVEAAQEKSVT